MTKQTKNKKPTLIENDMQAADKQAQNLQVIDSQFGDQLPYDKNRIENECQFYLVQGTKAMLELGKRLILLKEHELHGEFTESLKRVGVEPRTAQKMMKATMKFKDKNESGSLLSIGKLYTLMGESDDDLQELEEGGTIAGKTLDEIDRMTISELKKALRNAKKDKAEDDEATNKLLGKKDAKINSLDKKLNKRAINLEDWKAQALEVQGEIIYQSGILKQATNALDLLREHIASVENIPDEYKDVAHELLGSTYYNACKELTIDTGNLMMAAETLFGAYDLRPIPILEELIKTTDKQ